MGSTPADLKPDSEYEPSRDELAELRALLLGQQLVELGALRNRLDDPNLRAEELSQVLARAVALSSKRDRALQRSFYPIVEQALKISITKNPGILATSLAPIIGESVRKAVADAFRDAAQTVNIALENSLSWQSVQWRIESWRTGKSFGEIVLLRSQRYKVWQVFLIHRETGLSLQHVEAPGGGVSEAELVSSMLTAIQDFARDVAERTISTSARLKDSEDLEGIKLGKFWIWVHHGPQMLLAATIVGTPPTGLGNVLAKENELIHREFAEALAVFSGDTSAFDAARPHLEKCLLGSAARPRESSPWWIAALAVVLLVFAAAGFIIHRRNNRWSGYLERLRAEPGIVVTSSDRYWWSYSLAGLRDPLASDPLRLAGDFGIDPARIQAHFEPYLSLDERLVRERAFDSEKEALQKLMVLFPVNSSVLQADHATRLDAIEEHLNRLQEAARELGREVHLNIYGRADQTGAETKNATLSKERAERVFDALRERGVAPETLTAIGLGNSDPIRQGSAAYQLEVNRSVSLKVEQHRGGRQ